MHVQANEAAKASTHEKKPHDRRPKGQQRRGSKGARHLPRAQLCGLLTPRGSAVRQSREPASRQVNTAAPAADSPNRETSAGGGKRLCE